MNNLTLFVNSFCSYLFVYVIFAACIVISFIIGINLRKMKNKKEISASVNTNESGDLDSKEE